MMASIHAMVRAPRQLPHVIAAPFAAPAARLERAIVGKVVNPTTLTFAGEGLARGTGWLWSAWPGHIKACTTRWAAGWGSVAKDTILRLRLRLQLRLRLRLRPRWWRWDRRKLQQCTVSCLGRLGERCLGIVLSLFCPRLQVLMPMILMIAFIVVRARFPMLGRVSQHGHVGRK